MILFDLMMFCLLCDHLSNDGGTTDRGEGVLVLSSGCRFAISHATPSIALTRPTGLGVRS